MLCVFFSTLDFHEIWHERYAIGGHPNTKPFNFLLSVITTWQIRELVRWGQH
jgi:hypothetical protein